MKLNEKQKELIEIAGFLNYTVKDLAMILNMPLDTIAKEIQNPLTEIYRIFVNGEKTVKTKVFQGLMKSVNKGDVAAIKEFQKMQTSEKISQQIKNLQKNGC